MSDSVDIGKSLTVAKGANGVVRRDDGTLVETYPRQLSVVDEEELASGAWTPAVAEALTSPHRFCYRADPSRVEIRGGATTPNTSPSTLRRVSTVTDFRTVPTAATVIQPANSPAYCHPSAAATHSAGAYTPSPLTTPMFSPPAKKVSNDHSRRPDYCFTI